MREQEEADRAARLAARDAQSPYNSTASNSPGLIIEDRQAGVAAAAPAQPAASTQPQGRPARTGLRGFSVADALRNAVYATPGSSFEEIEMPNEYGVYLHDMPHKELFAKDGCWLNNGCLRLEDYRRFASWVFPQGA